MSTDYRALCAELARVLAEEYGVQRDFDSGEPLLGSGAIELLSRARTALAQPEPEGVTDEEIAECLIAAGVDAVEAESHGTNRMYFEGWYDHVLNGVRAAIAGDRARLARYARPTIEPVSEVLTDEAIEELIWRHTCEIGDLGVGIAVEDAPAFIRAALARWAHPTIEPVPVSERLPEPEDCDARGWCWYWHPGEECWEMVPVVTGTLDEWTHWLPHHALPLPTPTP